jgi:hypothetical protein
VTASHDAHKATCLPDLRALWHSSPEEICPETHLGHYFLGNVRVV